MIKYKVYLTKWAVSGIITTQCVNRPMSQTLNYSANKDTYTDIALTYLCVCVHPSEQESVVTKIGLKFMV